MVQLNAFAFTLRLHESSFFTKQKENHVFELCFAALARRVDRKLTKQQQELLPVRSHDSSWCQPKLNQHWVKMDLSGLDVCFVFMKINVAELGQTIKTIPQLTEIMRLRELLINYT